MRRTLRTMALIGVLAAGAATGPGAATARAQLYYHGAGYFGGGPFTGGGFFYERYGRWGWNTPYLAYAGWAPYYAWSDVQTYPYFAYPATYPLLSYVASSQNAPAPKVIVPRRADAPAAAPPEARRVEEGEGPVQAARVEGAPAEPASEARAVVAPPARRTPVYRAALD